MSNLDRRVWHPFDPSYSHADRCVVCGHAKAAHPKPTTTPARKEHA